MTVIQDPLNGYPGRIRSDGRFQTESLCKNTIYDAITHGHGHVLTNEISGNFSTVANTLKYHLFIKNLSASRYIIVQKIVVTSDVNGKFDIVLAPAYSSGGTIVSTQSPNLTFPNASISADLYAGNDLSLTSVSRLTRVGVKANEDREIEDIPLILGQNNTVAFGFVGDSATGQVGITLNLAALELL